MKYKISIIVIAIITITNTMLYANNNSDKTLTNNLSFADDAKHPYQTNNLIENRLDSCEKEIKRLNNRVEFLEQQILILQKTLYNQPKLSNQIETSINKEEVELNSNKINAEQSVSVLPIKQNNLPEQQGDVFEVVNDNTTPKTPGISDEKKEYDLALASLKENKLEIAEQKFADFISKYPNSKLQSNAHFWYAETFFKRNFFDKAAIYYLKSYKNFPKGEKAADSLLKLSLALGALDKKTEACNILDKLETEFPKRSASSLKKAQDARVKFGC